MIVQKLLDSAGVLYDYAGVNAETVDEVRRCAAEDPSRHLLLKCHDTYFEAEPRQRIFWCRRNACDMVGSRMRMGQSVDTAMRDLAASLALERRYRGRTDVCVLDYDALYADPLARVRRIAEFLGLSTAPEVMDRICAATAVDVVKATADALEGADGRTELRPGHVGDTLGRPGSYDLSPDIRARIMEIEAVA